MKQPGPANQSESDRDSRVKVLEEKLSILMNNTNEAFLLVDLQFNIVTFNKKFFTLYAKYLGKEVQKGDSILNYAQPNRGEAVKAIYEAVFKGETASSEVQIPLPDQALTFEIHFKPAYDERETIIGAFVNISDITDQRKAQEMLIASEKRFRALVENSDDAVAILSAEGTTLYVSPAIETILGYSEEEIKSLSVLSTFHPDDIPLYHSVMAEVFSKPGIPVQTPVVRIQHKNSSWVYIEATLTNMLHDPVIGGIIDNFRDVTKRILAEQQKDSERKNKEALINNTENAIWSVDYECRLIVANDVFLKTVKKATGKVLKNGDHLLLKEEFPLEFINFWEGLYKKALSGASFKKEIYSENAQTWFEISFHPIFEAGSITGIACQAMDITESKLAAISIRDSEEKRRLIMNAALDAIICIDTKGIITFWNPQAEKVFGWKEEEVTGKLLSSLIIPEPYGKMHDKGIEHYLKTGHGPALNRLLELTAKRRDGSEFPVELTVLPIKQGGEEFFCAFIRDISKRKKDEALLKKINAQLINAQQIAQVGYWELDLINNVSYWSDETYRICGLEKETTKPSRELFFSLIHPEERALILEKYNSTLENADPHAPSISEYRIVHKNGTIRHIQTKSEFILNENGKPIRNEGTIQDITAMKETEKALLELNNQIQKRMEELAVSNAELEQFAYVASHDLQEPLRMVTSFLTQLEKKYADQLDEKAHQYIHFATDGAKRMRTIILDLLEYSRVGKKEYERETIDLNDLLKEAVQLHRTSIEEKRATIIWKNLPVIQAGRTPIQQVFQNLISNALKYQKENEQPIIEIQSQETLTEWIFSVSDNGIGIEPQFFDKIFVIFQRLHNKDDYSGTGIGLSICKKIIENQKGRIWLTSTPGKGSTFYFTILK